MKLSKKNASLQRAIHKAVASGKALGGLIVGLAATVAGCRDHHSPADTMGSYPNTNYQENATNENARTFATDGEIAEPKPQQQPAKPNAVNEKRRKRRLNVIGKFPAQD